VKITIFQADKGDCLLLESVDGKLILVDGGMSASYRKHVAPTLHDLAQQKKALDLVCVSHIDQDHISGILEMMDNLVDWRVYDFWEQQGAMEAGVSAKKPKSLRPPEIASIWHNAFHVQLEQNSGKIEDMLAAFSSLLSVSTIPEFRESANFFTSKKEAVQLSRRINVKQLNIPLNDHFQGRLIYLGEERPNIEIGDFKLQIIGPSEKSLQKLRDEWNTWLEENEEVLKKIRAEAVFDEKRLVTNLHQLLEPLIIQADRLGQRSRVTTPNLASIMFLLEEAGKMVIMTGDGHADDIREGLESLGYLDGENGIHVDVLKVQHHGSEHNIDKEFCRLVTADHYIFCGNGAHENPDLKVLKVLINSRIGDTQDRSPNVPQNRSFTLWFNSSSNEAGNKNRKHMKEVEKIVREFAERSNGIMKLEFMKKGRSKLELTV
jgi:hypothetical protein